MSDLQERIAKAMEAKRLELINQPLARIWPELALVAIQETRAPNETTVSALAEATAQLLDDMGKDGKSVCLAAKAQARVAYEPFIDEPEWAQDCLMPLEEAKRILKECDG